MAPGCPACPPGPCALNFAATCASWRRSIPRRTTRPGSASECRLLSLFCAIPARANARASALESIPGGTESPLANDRVHFSSSSSSGRGWTAPCLPPQDLHTRNTLAPDARPRSLPPNPPPPTPPQARPCRAPRRGGPQLCREGAHRGAATQRRLQQLHASLHRYAHLQPAALPHLPPCSSSVRVRRTRPPHPALPCPARAGCACEARRLPPAL